MERRTLGRTGLQVSAVGMGGLFVSQYGGQSREVAEVEANVDAASRGSLPVEVLRRLEEIAAMVPFRPFEEPFTLPFERPYAGPGHA